MSIQLEGGRLAQWRLTQTSKYEAAGLDGKEAVELLGYVGKPATLQTSDQRDRMNELSAKAIDGGLLDYLNI